MSTETKHTATPWSHTKLCGQASGPHAETCIGVIGQNGTAVAWINLNPSQGDKVEDGFADAARIVACVNACAEIEDPGLSLRHAKSVLQTVAMCSENLELRKHAEEALRALGR